MLDPGRVARNYSDEEVEAIFRRALERQVEDEDGFEHDELVAAAREVGLSEDAIDRAVREIEGERGDEAIREKLAHRKRERWLRHFVTYFVVAGGFLGMHALGYVGAWAIWLAFGWGMGVALEAFGALRGPTEEAVRKENKKLNRKARRKAQGEARREAKRRKADERTRRRRSHEHRRGAGNELERVIEEGVTLLLSAASKRLREATAKLDAPPQTEFERYVAKKKSEKRDVMVTPPPERQAQKRRAPPRARVEIDEDDDEGLERQEGAAERRRGRSRP